MDKEKFLSFVAGMEYAAMLVGNHWNDFSTMVNQHDQSKRSEASIKYSAANLTESNVEEILNGRR